MKRRMLTILLLFCVLAALCGCGAEKAASRTVFAMDTVMNLTVYGADKATLDAAQAKLEGLERLLDRTEENSEIYALNHGGAVENEEVRALLDTALTISAATNGAFDPTIAPVMDAWGFTTDAFRVPTEAELSALLEAVDASRLSPGFTTLPKGMALDLGGIAKGYAGSVLRGQLRDAGITSAVIDLGGDVFVLGQKGGEGLFGKAADWRIAVKDPANPAEFLGVVALSDSFVVTSGVYERNFEENGTLYHHIIDPATGRPVENGLVSVSVICGADYGAWADALSTACFVLGVEDSLALREELRGTVPFELIMVTEDLSAAYEADVLYTDGLKECFTPAKEGNHRYANVG